MKKCIVVLGVHRSGTSVLAGLVSIVGAYAGEDLMLPTEDNPKGYFENNAIVSLNEKILNEFGSAWNDPVFTLDNVPKSKLRKFIDKAKTIISKEIKYIKKLVIKDPRLCVLFPIWEQALKELDITIKVILIYRNPLEVAHSLKVRKRDGLLFEHGLLLWAHLFLQAEFLSRKYKPLIIEYDKDFYDLKIFLKVLHEFINNESTSVLDRSIIKKAKEFYSPKLKNHSISFENISDDFPMYFKRLIDLIIKKQISNKRKINSIRKEHLNISQLFLHDWYLNKKSIERKIILQNQFKKEQELVKNKHNENTRLKQTLQQAQQEKEAIQNAYEVKQQELEASKQELEASKQELEASKQELEASKQELEASKQELEASQQELEVSNQKKLDLINSIAILEKTLEQKKLTKEKLESVVNLFFEKYPSKQIIKSRSSLLDIFKYKKQKQLFNDSEVIKQSGFFSPLFYLLSNPDVAEVGMDPLFHYCKFGWKENRKVSDKVDISGYIKSNPDIIGVINPLIHFIENGIHSNFTDPPPQSEKVEKGNILNFFEYPHKNFQNLSFDKFLYFYGVLFPQKTITNRDVEFEVLSLRAKLLQKHLINWDQEKVKPKNKGLISIIILAYGNNQLTDKCLESIFNSTNNNNFEVIVVNNSQDKKDIASLEKWKNNSGIKIINSPINLNFSLGCNLGFSHSIGSTVVFLNNDTTVSDYWLDSLVLPLENQNISITQPKLLYPDNKLQCMGLVFSNRSTLAYPIYQNQDISSEVLNKNRLFLAVTAACFAVRANDFSLVEGFDVSFINGQEDVDFCLRLNRLKNTYAMYVHTSKVFHYEGKSTGRGKFIINNRKLFITNFKGKIKRDDSNYYKEDGFTINKWILDSSEFKKQQVENYIPEIFKNNELYSGNDFIIANNFHIKGNLKYSDNKVAIIIAAHFVGKEIFGGERSFLDMVYAIDDSRFNIIVVVPNASNQNYIDELTNKVCSIYVIPYKMWSELGENNDLIKLLEFIYLSNNIQLVYVNTIMCREPLTAAHNLDIKTLVHVREAISYDEVLLKEIPLCSVERIIKEIVSGSDYLIMNSKFTSSLFDTNRKDIIYNKIDTDLFSFIDNDVNPDKVIFGLISSNIPKKGIFDFLEIAKRCKNVIPNAHFLLIGPINSHTEKIKKKISFFRLSNLEVRGYISTPEQAVSECNVILGLSHFAESFGRTIGEALAGGRPVIAYEKGAIPELVHHKENGILVPFKNYFKLIEAIHFFCENSQMISQMGNTGRKTIAKISNPDIYKSKLNKVLNRCLVLEAQTRKKISIIIPVFNAYEQFYDCIISVINTTSHLKCKIIIIDDASTDQRIKHLLNNFSKLSNIDIYVNKNNIGYTNTINRGIEYAADSDVILLNSDTVVTNNWAVMLQKTAYSNDQIGTVTAMSDNAGAFSFPLEGKENPKPLRMPYNNYAELITDSSKGLPPIEVPTGSGFCLFIKRKLLNKIGLFDSELFPRGYGEENDFCMRAIEAGYKNVISTNTFVFHVRSASFGIEKEELIKVGIKQLLKKYPTYMLEINKAFSRQEIQELRKTIQLQVDVLKKVEIERNEENY